MSPQRPRSPTDSRAGIPTEHSPESTHLPGPPHPPNSTHTPDPPHPPNSTHTPNPPPPPNSTHTPDPFDLSPGLLTPADLRALDRVDHLFAIVGAGAARSRSPQLHNAAYRIADLSALYLPFPGLTLDRLLACADDLTAIGLPLRGLTVGAPYKERALQLAADASPRARQAGAANLLLRRGDAWFADTTDPEGVLVPLAARGISPAGRDVAVLGCGGAGRAIAAALRDAGARVTLVNRGRARGELAAGLLALPFRPRHDFRESQHEIIVHATPCADTLPLDPARLAPDAVIVELVYGPQPTPLVRETSARGHRVIDGHDVLAAQFREQYRRMIGAPLEASAPRHHEPDPQGPSANPRAGDHGR